MTELITYETIRAIQRAEIKEMLQPLPKDFYKSIRSWLDRKEREKSNISMMEIESAKKLIKDIINRRQRKIITAALGTLRGDLPPANLTEEEEKLFEKLMIDLKEFSRNIHEELFGYTSEIENKIKETKEMIEQLKSSEEKPKTAEESNPETKIEINNKADVVEIKKEPSEQLESKKIKILKDLPKFVAKDLKSYGPFKCGDIIDMPSCVADIMISRKIADINF